MALASGLPGFVGDFEAQPDDTPKHRLIRSYWSKSVNCPSLKKYSKSFVLEKINSLDDNTYDNAKERKERKQRWEASKKSQPKTVPAKRTGREDVVTKCLNLTSKDTDIKDCLVKHLEKEFNRVIIRIYSSGKQNCFPDALVHQLARCPAGFDGQHLRYMLIVYCVENAKSINRRYKQFLLSMELNYKAWLFKMVDESTEYCEMAIKLTRNMLEVGVLDAIRSP